MLPKENRLLKERDFDQVHKEGKFIPGKHLVIKIIPNKFSVSRFGIIVSNKVSKKPTIRNKIKRRLREIIREGNKSEKIKKGFDIIVITKSSIVDEEFESIKRNFFDVLKRAEL